MKKFATALILVATASFALLADDTAKKVDLQKALLFAKGEKYQIDTNARWSFGNGERNESGNLRFVLTNTIVALDSNNEPSEYTLLPVKASIATDGKKAEEEEFKDGDHELRIIKKEDRWELWTDKRVERAPLCWLALGQSPDFARMLFPAKLVRAGETWDVDLKAIEKYVTTMFDMKSPKENNHFKDADLKTTTWNGTGKLAKIENGNAIVEISLSGTLKLANDANIEVAGKFTATIDLEKAMISKLDGTFTADFKWERSMHAEVEGSVVFEKMK